MSVLRGIVVDEAVTLLKQSGVDIGPLKQIYSALMRLKSLVSVPLMFFRYLWKVISFIRGFMNKGYGWLLAPVVRTLESLMSAPSPSPSPNAPPPPASIPNAMNQGLHNLLGVAESQMKPIEQGWDFITGSARCKPKKRRTMRRVTLTRQKRYSRRR